MTQLDELLSTAIERRWCTGYQVHVRHRGRTVLDVAGGVDGRRRPVSPSTMFSIYCAGKPLTALAISRLVGCGELSWTDRLGDVIDGPMDPSIAELTVDDVVTHRSGLFMLRAPVLTGMNSSTRELTVRSLVSRRTTDGVAVYTEAAGWELLRLVIESLADGTAADVIERTVLAPCGADDDVSIGLPREDPRHERIGVNVDLGTGRVVPLLWEASRDNLAQPTLASGAVASMRGLARIYGAMLESSQRSAPLPASEVDDVVAPRTVRGDDPVLGRRCRFGRGVMVDLADHDFGDGFTSASFGHTGLSGMTFGGADPGRDLAFAVHLNGIRPSDQTSDDPDVSAQARRRAIATAILTTVDIDSSSPADPHQEVMT